MNFSLAFDQLVLDPPGVAQLLKISERHVLDMRQQGRTFPQPTMCGANRPRWHVEAILAWVLADQATPPSSELPEPTRKRKGTPRVH